MEIVLNALMETFLFVLTANQVFSLIILYVSHVTKHAKIAVNQIDAKYAKMDIFFQ